MESIYLNNQISSQLYPYQINKINMQIKDFIQVNSDVNKFVFERCPKCGAIHPRLLKGGYTSKGKQMLRCTECNKRFVVDSGQLTFYSHQDQAKWNDLIIDTEEGSSLKSTAKVCLIWGYANGLTGYVIEASCFHQGVEGISTRLPKGYAEEYVAKIIQHLFDNEQ